MRNISPLPSPGSSGPGAGDRPDRRLSARQADRLLSVGERLLHDASGPKGNDTETLATIARLLHAATHDTLTGLPTRGLLLERLEHELTRTDSIGQVAVLFVDLDNFKLVNDSLGHDSGDVVLGEMARRILECAGPDDVVSRFGGDEMVILHAGARAGSEMVLGARIVAAMVEPISVAGREIVVSASVGVAICDRGSETAEQLLRDADTALYAAKERGRNRLERFNEDLHARVARRMQLESDLRVALREAQLFVQYQPQVNLQTGQLVGVEALVRWRHPAHGMMTPAEFIPVAEESRLIGTLGRQVLRTACRQLAEWTAATPGQRLTMTVNVSPRQLDDPDYVPELQQVLEETGIDPATLCLELTESGLIDRDTDTVSVLTRIRALGVYVAIDDFGTEYSSLARLRGLPVEVLKIDRSFIDGLPSESGDTAIVTSILSLACAMGKHVIAEGVERPEQAAALRAMGCLVAQGYLFSVPVDPDVVPLLRERSLLPAFAGDAAGLARIDSTGFQRRGHRAFIDEFLDHIGAPMGARPPAGS